MRRIASSLALICSTAWLLGFTPPVLSGEPFSRESYLKALTRLEDRLTNVMAAGEVRRDGYVATHVHRIMGASFQSQITYPEDRAGSLANTPRMLIRNEGGEGLFKLANDSTGNDYYIAGLGEQLQSDVVRFHRRYCKPLSLAATHVFDFSMRELLNDPDVQWSVSPSNDASGARVSIVLDLRARRGYFQEAVVDFLPNSQWVIAGYELKHSSDASGGAPATFRGTVSYSADGDESGIVPDLVTIELDEPPKPRQLITEWKRNQAEPGVVTPDWFTLEKFGLGTLPTDQIQRPVPWFWIVNLLVLVAFSAGYFVLRRRA